MNFVHPNWSPPLGTQTVYRRLTAGDLIAFRHTAWLVTAVDDLELSDADRDVWLAHGMPDLATWNGRPYRAHLKYMGGVRPDDVPADGPMPPCWIDVPAGAWLGWHVFKSQRWPQCSCCGEPMPCRAEMQERYIAASLDKVEQFARRVPGACWACEEPITARQQAVDYPGENLDFPGGPVVRFHLRRACLYSAHSYENRWVAADPRRERILTWPDCPGRLIVHGDGSSECTAGDQNPECRGHLTHDHGYLSACFSPGQVCPRGCTAEGHPGTQPSPPRPLRRDHTPLPDPKGTIK